MPIRLAFIGSGHINRVHAKAALDIGGIELSAVVNHRPESMEKFASDFSIKKTYLKIEDLIQEGGVDAFVVATPNKFHADQTIAALNAGYHVLVEKPMAMNGTEARAMVAAAQANQKTLMVAHCFRYDPQVRWLRKVIQSDKIGSIVRTKGFNRHIQWGPQGWFAQKYFAGGGALADMAIHSIDTARFLLGDPLPVSIFARIGTHYQAMDVDDTATLIINWENGSYSVIEGGWWQPDSDNEFTSAQVFGSTGYARIFPPKICKDDQVEQPALTPEPDSEEMYDIQMAAFVEHINGAAHSSGNAKNGLINMLIVDAAYESAKSGQLISFKISE
jgi:predicted dehydrogenase